MGRGATVLLPALVAGACATAGGPAAVIPDSAAIAAAATARAGFEARFPVILDPELTAGIAEIGHRAVAGSPRIAAAPPSAGLAEGWRFLILDRSEPEVFLFADRNLFLSRGVLAELSGEPALEELFRGAAETYAAGGFRSGPGGALSEQPLRLPLPSAPGPPREARTGGGERSAGGSPGAASHRDRWLDLVDGLVFGEPPEFGAADGRELWLPRADLRLALRPGARFEPAARGEFSASRFGEPIGLTVRERQPFGIPAGADLDTERLAYRVLAARLAAAASEAGQHTALAEVFRVRGFSGVRARLFDGAARSVDPSRPDGLPSRAPAGLVALLRAPGALVEVALDCAGRGLEDCEALFVEVLESADRLWGAPLPEPLRLTVWPVAAGGPARAVLGRLAAEGRSAVSARVLFFLNRGWLEEQLTAGDRVLIVSRERRAVARAARGAASGTR